MKAAKRSSMYLPMAALILARPMEGALSPEGALRPQDCRALKVVGSASAVIEPEFVGEPGGERLAGPQGQALRSVLYILDGAVIRLERTAGTSVPLCSGNRLKCWEPRWEAAARPRPQSAVPDRRPALGAACSEAHILRPKRGAIR